MLTSFKGQCRYPCIQCLKKTFSAFLLDLAALLQQFFAQIYGEAQTSRAAPGHVAIAQLSELGKLQRHYTLNIDGLSQVGVWHDWRCRPGVAALQVPWPAVLA